MSIEEAIAQHAETEEVLRLLLPEFAELITSPDLGFNLGSYLANGDAYLFGFANLFAEDCAKIAGDEVLAGANAFLQEIDLAGGAIDAETRRRLLEGALEQITANNAGFAEGVARDFRVWIEGLRAAGMTDQDILDALTSNPAYLDGVLSRFRNGLKDMGRQFVTVLDDLSYAAAFERRSTTQKLPNEHTWVTRYDKNVCGRKETGASAWRISCWHRHGKTKSYVEWRRAGLPGSGVTFCRKRCRCLLMPKARIRGMDLTDPVRITKAVERAAKQAEKRMREIAAYARQRADEYRGA